VSSPLSAVASVVDEGFMRRAIRLAARAEGRTRPNPMVGCVIVGASGKVLAEGYHHRAGQAHAEMDALGKVQSAAGATVYVTLEPCNHQGRTGPCAEALVAASVKRVVVGMRDPNPRVPGGGVERLRRAGIAVEVGVLEAECRWLGRMWIHFMTTGLPWVTLKAAVTLDGRMAARGGDSRWVTGEAARKEAHRLRATHDAILVGAGTVRADDPELTVRSVRGIDPVRVVVDGKLGVGARARVLPALIFAANDAPVRRFPGETEVVRLAGRGRVSLAAVLKELGERGVQSVLVEGGGEIHGQLLAAGLVDEVALFVAPKLIGSGGVPLLGSLLGPSKMAEAWTLSSPVTKRLGDDVYIRGALTKASARAKPRR